MCFTVISTFNLIPSATGTTGRNGRKTYRFYRLIRLVASCPSLTAQGQLATKDIALFQGAT